MEKPNMGIPGGPKTPEQEEEKEFKKTDMKIYWSFHSKKDPRWNARLTMEELIEINNEMARKTADQKLREKIEKLKQELGMPPDDLEIKEGDKE